MISSTQLLERFSPLSASSSGYAPLESNSSVSPSGVLTELTDSLHQPSKLFKSSSVAPQAQAIPEANNTLSKAYNIGTLSGSRTFSDFVGSTDSQDFYRFSLGTIKKFTLSLKGLSADADV